jgi:hypothetical protein
MLNNIIKTRPLYLCYNIVKPNLFKGKESVNIFLVKKTMFNTLKPPVHDNSVKAIDTLQI